MSNWHDVKEKPKGDLKQHHLNFLFKAEKEEQRIELLGKLAKREMSYKEFKSKFKGERLVVTVMNMRSVEKSAYTLLYSTSSMK